MKANSPLNLQKVLDGTGFPVPKPIVIVRKRQMDLSSEAHPGFVILCESIDAAEKYITEHQGLLPQGEYLSYMLHSDYCKTV